MVQLAIPEEEIRILSEYGVILPVKALIHVSLDYLATLSALQVLRVYERVNKLKDQVVGPVSLEPLPGVLALPQRVVARNEIELDVPELRSVKVALHNQVIIITFADAHHALQLHRVIDERRVGVTRFQPQLGLVLGPVPIASNVKSFKRTDVFCEGYGEADPEVKIVAINV